MSSVFMMQLLHTCITNRYDNANKKDKTKFTVIFDNINLTCTGYIIYSIRMQLI